MFYWSETFGDVVYTCITKKYFCLKLAFSIDDMRHSLFFLLQSLLHRSRHEEVSFNVFEDLINESNFI